MRRASGLRRAPCAGCPPVAGFTLIELLVAMLILGIMCALGYGAYRQARISAERTEASLERTREIEFGMRILAMDFSEMLPRPVRDPLGQNRLPSLRGGTGAGTLSNPAGAAAGTRGGLGAASKLTFNPSLGFGAVPGSSSFGPGADSTPIPLFEVTRGGWSNTAGQQRGTQQRVSYALAKDVLTRSYTTALDIVQNTQPVTQNLLTQVKAVQLRYLDSNQNWQTQWPPPLLPLPDSLWTRPVAVEITIEFKDWGIVRRLIEVAG